MHKDSSRAGCGSRARDCAHLCYTGLGLWNVRKGSLYKYRIRVCLIISTKSLSDHIIQIYRLKCICFQTICLRTQAVSLPDSLITFAPCGFNTRLVLIKVANAVYADFILYIAGVVGYTLPLLNTPGSIYPTIYRPESQLILQAQLTRGVFCTQDQYIICPKIVWG